MKKIAYLLTYYACVALLFSCATTEDDNARQLRLALIVATAEHPDATRAVVAFLDAVANNGNITDQLRAARDHDPDNAWAYVLAANYLGSYTGPAIRAEAAKLANELRV